MTIIISNCGIGLADIPHGFGISQPLAYVGECQCGQGQCIGELYELQPIPEGVHCPKCGGSPDEGDYFYPLCRDCQQDIEEDEEYFSNEYKKTK